MNIKQKDVDLLLVKRAKKGDMEAFDLLVLKYQAKVISVARGVVKDNQSAEDVAQETFIKAFKSLNSFREESAFYTWIYRITVNTAKNFVLSKNRKKENSESELQRDGFELNLDMNVNESPEDFLLEESLKNDINNAFKSLPEEIRVSLTMRELDGLSYEDISLHLKCPIGTVRSRIFRGREILSEAIEKNAATKVNKASNYE
ncbi:MAG: sigma-70 family RNA polymerase sigma factor [SAR86 cluster bacterium]|jgi:RNA polymerase sigma-70 factor, ECF subfamily|nr:sigma-70 family RNA polymerase sigma factor [SAR86 cluster bacterium]|tara:strand:- start:1899 stop:2507 length:609 start_codon:yes stop_codon:yes gene_type:complete